MSQNVLYKDLITISYCDYQVSGSDNQSLPTATWNAIITVISGADSVCFINRVSLDQF